MRRLTRFITVPLIFVIMTLLFPGRTMALRSSHFGYPTNLVNIETGYLLGDQGKRADAQSDNGVGKLDIEGITLLLDLFEIIMERNADYETVTARLKDMDPEKQRVLLEEKQRANADDTLINEKIDALVNSRTYQLYYRKFRNVTPEIHRDVFYALPYQAINSPAGIADNYRELCLNHESFGAWVTSVVSSIDLGRCNNIAREWLPAGQYGIPNTYFIYDGNGDAFALYGQVCFDLFSLVVRKQTRENRFDNLSSVGVGDIERILGHEFQHVHAAKYLYPAGRSNGTWQERWKDRIIRQIVSEGVAMRCDVKAGIRRAAMEDRATVEYWIGQLNEKLSALDNGTITESEMQKWWGATFHATARGLLKDYLRRTYPDENTDEKLRKLISARPSFVYTLGWWMISRILESGTGKDGVIGLLSQPRDLFTLYNASLAGGQTALRVAGEAAR